MMKLMIATVASIVVSLLVVGKAEAGQYNINATSCVADSATIAGGLYHGGSGKVDFTPGKTGVIVLYCPVPYNLGFSPAWMSMLYADTSTTDYVKLMWIKMNVNTGAIGTDAQIFNTNSSGSVVAQGVGIGTSYLPASYAYWVRVDLSRATLATNPTLYMVHVEG